jgi:hypothetical protein
MEFDRAGRIVGTGSRKLTEEAIDSSELFRMDRCSVPSDATEKLQPIGRLTLQNIDSDSLLVAELAGNQTRKRLNPCRSGQMYNRGQAKTQDWSNRVARGQALRGDSLLWVRDTAGLLFF